jgi:hypothetical protein
VITFSLGILPAGLLMEGGEVIEVSQDLLDWLCGMGLIPSRIIDGRALKSLTNNISDGGEAWSGIEARRS